MIIHFAATMNPYCTSVKAALCHKMVDLEEDCKALGTLKKCPHEDTKSNIYLYSYILTGAS